MNETYFPNENNQRQEKELQLEDYGDESSSDQQNFEVHIDNQMNEQEDAAQEMMHMMDLRDDG